MSAELLRRFAGKKISARRFKQIADEVLLLLDQDRSELSIALIGNAEMQRLNAQYRNRDYPTDVLSFPAEATLPSGVRLLGDVIISVDKARQQADERKRTLEQEMVTLLIHGVLHLLGFDHERSAKDARVMGQWEKKIYRALCERRLIQV
jgi:rRNA maturation RNase YbeY